MNLTWNFREYFSWVFSNNIDRQDFRKNQLLALFKVLARYFLGVTEENQWKPWSLGVASGRKQTHELPNVKPTRKYSMSRQ